MSNNLTPDEIAAITEKARQLYPDSMNAFGQFIMEQIRTAYITAATEYAAEIKRLREGIENTIREWATIGYAATDLKQLLNNNP